MKICQNSNAHFFQGFVWPWSFHIHNGFCKRKPPKGGVSVELWVCFRVSLLHCRASGPFLLGTALSKTVPWTNYVIFEYIWSMVSHLELGVKELSLWNGECLGVTRDGALTTFLKFYFGRDYYSIVQQSWSPVSFLFAYGPNSAVSVWFAKCSLYKSSNPIYIQHLMLQTNEQIHTKTFIILYACILAVHLPSELPKFWRKIAWIDFLVWYTLLLCNNSYHESALTISKPTTASWRASTSCGMEWIE